MNTFEREKHKLSETLNNVVSDNTGMRLPRKFAQAAFNGD